MHYVKSIIALGLGAALAAGTVIAAKTVFGDD